jgi:hypothetical protein
MASRCLRGVELRRRFLVFVILGLVIVGGCSDETRSAIGDAIGDSDTAPSTTAGEPEDTSPEPEPTTPPTEAPEPEPEPDDGADSAETVSIALLGALVLGAIALLLLLRRSSRATPAPAGVAPAPPPPPTRDPAVAAWTARARTAYTNARWLQDTLVEDLAVWRSDALADPGAVDPGDRRSSAWAQLDERTAATANELYGLEVDAPSPQMRNAVREVLHSLQSVRAGFDARIAARSERRSIADDPTSGSESVTAAADRDLAAAAELEERRSRLARAIDTIAALLQNP